MVAGRFLSPPLPLHLFLTSPPFFLRACTMPGAEQFLRAPLADPNMGVTLDPATGMPYATVGGTLLMYKVLATGTVALSEWLFIKWRQYF